MYIHICIYTYGSHPTANVSKYGSYHEPNGITPSQQEKPPTEKRPSHQPKEERFVGFRCWNIFYIVNYITILLFRC